MRRHLHLEERNPNGSDCFEYAWIVAGINWVTAHHNDHPTQLEVANCSFETAPNIPDIQYPNPVSDAIRNAVVGSMNSGVSYTIAVGNENQSLDDPQTQRKTPRDVMDLDDGRKDALLIGAENQQTDYRLVVYKADGTIASGSTYGSKLSLFSPGYRVTSASSQSNIATNINDSTSRASAIAAGVVALYLQGRTGMNDCASHKIQGPSSATTGAGIATCPDRVSQFIRANANICDSAITGCQRINNRGASPDRLLFTGYIPTTDNFNPIDNQRFFVWQQYKDFLGTEPDEIGLDWWTKEITGGQGHNHNCNAGMNVNSNTCTHDWRALDSRAFWVAVYPSWFNTSYGLTNFDPSPYATPNEKWLDEVYWVYLRRRPPHSDPNPLNWDTGFKFWFDALNSGGYGNPANQAGVNFIIQAFIESTEYRERFGQP